MSVVGFDLGNESCIVGVARQRGIDVVLNEESKRETPAIVCFGDKQRFIGTAGAANSTMNPKNSVSQVKRLLGRKFADPELQRDLQSFPFRVSEGPDGFPLVHAQYLGEERSFTPTQLLAMVLSNLKTIAEGNLNSAVIDCCIGIPVYFTDLQRRAVLDAATIAGLRPLRLFHETTATALAYGIYKTDLPENDQLNVAFVDVGHASMQVSIVGYKKGQLKMLSHAYDRSLGGRDFDEALFKHFAAKFKEEYKIDVYQNARACIRLRVACEKLKKMLSANPEAPMNIECLMDEKDVRGFIKRDEFEQISAPVLERVKGPLEKALAEAGLTTESVHFVEVVGSGSRVPAIIRIITEFFGKEPRRTMNASECVARGCALQCAILSPTFKVREFQVNEGFPFSIALSWKPDSQNNEPQQTVVFPKGNPIPSVKALTFYRSNTFAVDVLNVQTDDLQITEKISTYTIGPFQSSKGEKAKLRVKVRLNIHGIVSLESATMLEEEEVEVPVSATSEVAKDATKMDTDDGTDVNMQDSKVPSDTAEGTDGAQDSEEKSVPMDTDAKSPSKKKVKKTNVPVAELVYGAMGPDELQKAVEKEFEMALQDRVMEETKEKKNAVEAYVYDMRNKLYEKYNDFVTSEDKESLMTKLQEVEDWLYEDGEDETKGVYLAKLEELKKVGGPIELRYKESEERGSALEQLGDDHNIMIYYPSYAGGGMKELFRKVGNRSSEFYPDVRKVRRDGSYIYEEFMPTGGTDVKVYTVGPGYAHAEARKSPVVDGVVMRNSDGKEVRYPVLLTPTEKQIAWNVCQAFRQAVCGFDLLRCDLGEARSYVCDVNGWSFVKSSYKYYDDAACILRKMFLDEKAPHISSTIPANLPWKISEPVQPPDAVRGRERGTVRIPAQSEELRCVIAVIRHGDRTPKQKVKLKVTQEKLIKLMLKYNGGNAHVEAKLKSALQLQDLLDATRILVPRARSGRESDSDAEVEHAEKLRQVRAVLEEGGYFSGIYRKVQLKPSNWVCIPKSSGQGEEQLPIEALMILKYGGVLTHAGRKQAEELGRYFRNNMYPSEGPGLLRLHSTYRHDLKIYSSDEGRVQMSAAAFAKGLLDLEGELTPILVSLVSKDSSMLDGLEDGTIDINEAKARLHDIIVSSKVANGSKPAGYPWMVDGAGVPTNAAQLLTDLAKLTKEITAQVKLLSDEENEVATDSDSPNQPYDQAKALWRTAIDMDRIAAGLPCGSESFLLMFARWKKLERDFYNGRKKRFDTTQIPDIYDSCKYDLLHNSHLNLNGLHDLFKVSKLLADGVIPNEYGINPKQKLKIGSKIARRLLGKILIDLHNTRREIAAIAAESITCHDPKMVSSIKQKERCYYGNVRNEGFERSSTDQKSVDLDSHKETKYCLDPKYANVVEPERRVRTRLYFTSESHIHSLMNVLRYCYLDESLNGEESLICKNSLDGLFKTKELDYMSYIVLRMFENTEVPLEDPKRFRIEMTFSRGADISCLESAHDNDSFLPDDHTVPIMEPERLQEASSYLTLDEFDKMTRLFAMPAEDFPPATPSQCLSVRFCRDIELKGARLQH